MQNEIRDLLSDGEDFLGQEGTQDMKELMMEQRIVRLIIAGHIPLPCSATVAIKFLGTYDATSLLRKGTEER